jgi:hypothetical protein
VTKRHRDDEILEIPMLGAIMRCARWQREWHICLIPLPGGWKKGLLPEKIKFNLIFPKYLDRITNVAEN